MLSSKGIRNPRFRRRPTLVTSQLQARDARAFLMELSGVSDEEIDTAEGLRSLALWIKTRPRYSVDPAVTYRQFAIAYAAWLMDRWTNQLLIRHATQLDYELPVARAISSEQPTQKGSPHRMPLRPKTNPPRLLQDPSLGPEPYLELTMGYPAVASDQRARRKALSRDSRAIHCLVAEDIGPVDVEWLARQKGEGLDSWSRRAAKSSAKARGGSKRNKTSGSRQSPTFEVVVRMSETGSEAAASWSLGDPAIVQAIIAKLEDLREAHSYAVEHLDGDPAALLLNAD